MGMPFIAGQSAILLPVGAAEVAVAPWRRRFDPCAAQGVPAHVTALIPFLPAERLSTSVLSGVGEVCARTPRFEVTLRRFGRFPGVLYLDPEPASPFRELTEALVRAWPELKPYEGRFAEIIPHLTVADGVGAEQSNNIQASVATMLPIRATITEACLYVFDGAVWRLRARLELGAGG